MTILLIRNIALDIVLKPVILVISLQQMQLTVVHTPNRHMRTRKVSLNISDAPLDSLSTTTMFCDDERAKCSFNIPVAMVVHAPNRFGRSKIMLNTENRKNLPLPCSRFAAIITSIYRGHRYRLPILISIIETRLAWLHSGVHNQVYAYCIFFVCNSNIVCCRWRYYINTRRNWEICVVELVGG